MFSCLQKTALVRVHEACVYARGIIVWMFWGEQLQTEIKIHKGLSHQHVVRFQPNHSAHFQM